jgi:4-amino-4-deoxy-L-arabinose transferase-like glycosyltransferase
MARTPQRRALLPGTLAAIALACLVLLPLLGHNRLTDWDEGIYAAISRAMLSTGFLIPHFNIQPWLEKPPLEFWLTALCFKLFGVSEFTARLVSALSGIALIGTLHAWLTLRRNALTAWLSTLMLLATFGFLHAARVGEVDVLLTLGCTLALLGLAELHSAPTTAAYLFWLGFAIALMTKGAASVTLPLTLVLVLALDPTLLRRLRLHFWLGFLLFLALTLPWHLFMLHRFGHLFVANYLGLHVLARATSQIEGHITPWWYYLRVLLLSAAPFVLLYPIALIDTFRNPRLRPLRPFAIFALVTLTLFTLVQTRLPHYILPAYPALTLLTAAWLANWIANLLTHHPSRRFPARAIPAAIALYLLGALLTAGPRKSLHSPRLANGTVTPDNREQVALLKRVFLHPDPAVASIPGPLLSWRTGTYNPIPTTIFYANRPIQQVQLAPIPPATPRDIYAYNPIPLTQAVQSQPTDTPRLILLDRSLLPTLPATLCFTPIATSSTLELGTLTLHP